MIVATNIMLKPHVETTRQVWDWWVHQERFLQLHALEADLAKAQAWSLRQERRRQGVRLDRNFYLRHVLRLSSGVVSITAWTVTVVATVEVAVVVVDGAEMDRWTWR